MVLRIINIEIEKNRNRIMSYDKTKAESAYVSGQVACLTNKRSSVDWLISRTFLIANANNYTTNKANGPAFSLKINKNN